MAWVATRRLVGRLPWLANAELTFPKGSFLGARQHFKGKASDKGESGGSGRDTDCKCFVSLWLQRVLFVWEGEGQGLSLWAGGTHLQEARDVLPGR